MTLTRRPRTVAAVASLIALLALLTAKTATPTGGRPVTAGPMHRMPRGSVFTYGDGAPYVRVGDRFMDGLSGAIRFDTDQPVTITGVRVLGGGQALRYLGARLVPTPPRPWPYHGFDLVPGWPDPDPVAAPARVGRRMYRAVAHTVPAVGAVLRPVDRPGPAIEPMLLLGLEVVRDARDIRRGVAVDYVVGGRPYETRLRLRFEYCPTYPVHPSANCRGVHRG